MAHMPARRTLAGRRSVIRSAVASCASLQYFVLDTLAMYSQEKAAERLVRTQAAIGLTNADLAKRAGVTAHAWSQYRNGTRPIPHRALVMLKEEFGVTADWILAGDRSGLPHALHTKI